MSRHNTMDAKARRQRYAAALNRPELRQGNDQFGRAAPSSPTSAPVKVQDAATRALIDAAIKKRDGHAPGV